jgi:predicted DNA-binding protein
MIHHMHVLIELDDETLRRLERVAPGKSRKRSAFIRAAIQKSLWELEEDKTRRAYLAEPDLEPVPFDPSEWEPLAYGGFDPPTKRARKSAARKGSKRRA